MKKEVGTNFWTPGFEVAMDDKGNKSIKLTDHGNGWFDEDQQSDLKNQKDYFIL